MHNSGAFSERSFPLAVLFLRQKRQDTNRGSSLEQGDNSLSDVSVQGLYFSSLINPKFAASNCHTLQIGSISHSQAMRDARGRGFRNLPPRILETRLHSLPLDHHHLLSPSRLQVPQVACPRTKGPRVSVDNGVMVRASKPQEQRLKEGSKGSTCLLALDGAWSVKEGSSLVSIQQILCPALCVFYPMTPCVSACLFRHLDLSHP